MFSFWGRIFPSTHKELTHDKRIESAPIPHRVLIPFSQHTGILSKPIVKVGDSVKVGTKIGIAEGEISVPTHATISGKVIEIREYPHPVFSQRVLTCVIESDGQDLWEENIKPTDYNNYDKPTLINIIAEAGIVGLASTAFPTHFKLNENPLETLIINGCESEPFLTADHRIMVENPFEIIEGVKIIAKIINPKRIIIVIENNKPDAIIKLKEAITELPIPISLTVVKTKYPQETERLLIKKVLGIEIPSKGSSADAKVLVQNMQACYAIYEVVKFNKPLVEKVIAVTGQVKEPKNLRVRIGTPIINLVNFCGGYSEPPSKIIFGGPMTGIAQFSDEMPIIKSATSILVLSNQKIIEESTCIRCGRCVDTCPMNLLPCTINRLVNQRNFTKAKEYNVSDCIECGCCAYVCPSQIRLVHAFQFAKNEIFLKEKQ